MTQKSPGHSGFAVRAISWPSAAGTSLVLFVPRDRILARGREATIR